MEAWNPLNGLATVNVGFKKLHPDAKVPTYGSDEAAGADLYALEGAWVTNEITLVKTGISIELPAGFEAQVRPRSGLALKYGVTVVNAPGTIDSDYRGEIGVVLTLVSSDLVDFEIKPGDRIAQLVIAPVFRAQFLTTDGVFSPTKRGEGGFGSTDISEEVDEVHLALKGAGIL